MPYALAQIALRLLLYCPFIVLQSRVGLSEDGISVVVLPVCAQLQRVFLVWQVVVCFGLHLFVVVLFRSLC